MLREKERRGFHTPKIPAPPRGETGAANPHLKEGACAYGIGQEKGTCSDTAKPPLPPAITTPILISGQQEKGDLPTQATVSSRALAVGRPGWLEGYSIPDLVSRRR